MNQTHPTPDELVDYLHGELPAPRSAAIAAHVAGCPECADARDAEVSVTQLLRAHARAQERELPPGVGMGKVRHFRIHNTRRDGVHPNPARTQRSGKLLYQGIDSALRRRVSR